MNECQRRSRTCVKSCRMSLWRVRVCERGSLMPLTTPLMLSFTSESLRSRSSMAASLELASYSNYTCELAVQQQMRHNAM